MSNNTGLMMLVVRLSYYENAVVNVYKDGAKAPALKEIELPYSAFPHEPQIGEQFTLVVA